MCDYFDKTPLDNEEKLSEERVQKIKASVLSRIEEEKPMKHFSIKPFIIAAAITATGALSLITANAATDGAVMDGIAKTFSFTLNGEQVEGMITEYEAGDDGNVTEIELELPEGAEGITIAADGDDPEKYEFSWKDLSETIDTEAYDIISRYDEDRDVYYYVFYKDIDNIDLDNGKE